MDFANTSQQWSDKPPCKYWQWANDPGKHNYKSPVLSEEMISANAVQQTASIKYVMLCQCHDQKSNLLSLNIFRRELKMAAILKMSKY